MQIPVQIYFRDSDGALDRIRTIHVSEEQWKSINYVDYINFMDGSLDEEFSVHGATAIRNMVRLANL